MHAFRVLQQVIEETKQTISQKFAAEFSWLNHWSGHRLRGAWCGLRGRNPPVGEICRDFPRFGEISRDFASWASRQISGAISPNLACVSPNLVCMVAAFFMTKVAARPVAADKMGV